MRLLWTFMGYSKPYTFFAGAAQALAGMLLFFRHTTTLGALIAAVVMLNVVMVNFSYDVPVKLFSPNLLAMALFLAAPELRRLADLPVLNRPTLPANFGRPLSVRGMRMVKAGVKILVIGFVLLSTTKQALDAHSQYGEHAPRSPLYGLYEVHEFVRNGQSLPPLLTDAHRWKKIIFQFPSACAVRLMDDSMQYYPTEYDEAKKIVALLTGEEKRRTKNYFSYSRPDSEHLIMQGLLEKDSLIVKLNRIDESKLLLVNRGFQWINEFPFNR
jgi:hypothetical protein